MRGSFTLPCRLNTPPRKESTVRTHELSTAGNETSTVHNQSETQLWKRMRSRLRQSKQITLQHIRQTAPTASFQIAASRAPVQASKSAKIATSTSAEKTTTMRNRQCTKRGYKHTLQWVSPGVERIQKELVTSSALPSDHTDLALPSNANHMFPITVPAGKVALWSQNAEVIIKTLNNLYEKAELACNEARCARRHQAA